MENISQLLVDPNAWIALATLTVLELVLGIDNIVFISILSGKLPVAQQQRARILGLGLAMVTRLLLLASLSWIMKLKAPLFSVLGQDISGRDLILIVGGLFLIAKSTTEIHNKVELKHEEHKIKKAAASFAMVLIQIMVLDIVFSLDSVITAVGMTDQLAIMFCAIVISVIFMMLAARAISEFVDRHPTIKVLALSFLILIGVALLGEGFEMHIPRGYIYFAIAFAAVIEMLNIRLLKNMEQAKTVK